MNLISRAYALQLFYGHSTYIEFSVPYSVLAWPELAEKMSDGRHFGSVTGETGRGLQREEFSFGLEYRQILHFQLTELAQLL